MAREPRITTGFKERNRTAKKLPVPCLRCRDCQRTRVRRDRPGDRCRCLRLDVCSIQRQSQFPYAVAPSQDRVFKHADENQVPQITVSRCLEMGLSRLIWCAFLERLSESRSSPQARNTLCLRCYIRREADSGWCGESARASDHQLRPDQNAVHEEGL